jgi:TfoX N-terminal domain
MASIVVMARLPRRESRFTKLSESRFTLQLVDNPPVAYDEHLANRIRELLADEDGVTEKKMFGGLAFLIGGNMSVSASGQGGLLLRCGPAETEALLRKPHAAPFEMRGRAMDGWLRVAPEGVGTKRQLAPWVARGVAYARSLPAKA